MAHPPTEPSPRPQFLPVATWLHRLSAKPPEEMLAASEGAPHIHALRTREPGERLPEPPPAPEQKAAPEAVPLATLTPPPYLRKVHLR